MSEVRLYGFLARSRTNELEGGTRAADCVQPNLCDAPSGQGLGISCCDAEEEAALGLLTRSTGNLSRKAGVCVKQ